MPRIGDEALLLFVAFGYRSDYAACKVQYHKEYRQQSDERHQDACSQEIPERAKYASAVKECDAYAASIIIHGVSEVLDEARFLSGSESFLRIFLRLCRIDRGDPFNVHLLHSAVFTESDYKEPGFLGLVTCHRMAAASSA